MTEPRCYSPQRKRWWLLPSTKIWILFYLLLFFPLISTQALADARQLHYFRCCDSLSALTSLSNLSVRTNLTKTGPTLSPLLIPRVSGTDGNVKVRQFIVKSFEELGWHVELDEFEDDTPLGRKPFANIIATKFPQAEQKLVLAAHYDSKYFADFDFIGATDSAVPCAVLIDVAQTLNKLMDQQWDKSKSVQMIFFDGEEAFVQWTAKDSLYGSRHLAEKWANTVMMPSPDNDPASSGFDLSRLQVRDAVTPLTQMEVFILLDLLGTPDVTVFNTHLDTTTYFNSLVSIQRRLVDAGLLSAHLQGRVKSTGLGYLSETQRPYAQIEDDHIPFMKRGVKIVHIIPTSFPRVWHTKDDDADAIDDDTVHDWAVIFRVFVAEWSGLQVT
ncbi:hypothetical protein HDU85_000557 [Gaertneriomyces sp. JEL0708]|nr:hypothetical protein HDU85_000557 [Gaertneriomyces sp. JEL0708]